MRTRAMNLSKVIFEDFTDIIMETPKAIFWGTIWTFHKQIFGIIIAIILDFTTTILRIVGTIVDFSNTILSDRF